MNFHCERILLAALCTMLTTVTLADSGSTNKPAKTPASGPAATGYIEKFEVPERDEAGNLKWKLNGERAVIRPDGLMDVQNARAQFYTSNKVDMVFSTPACVLDRANNRAMTDDQVRIDRPNMVLTGVGGEWDGNKSLMVIRSNVCVIITGGQNVLGEQSKSK